MRGRCTLGAFVLAAAASAAACISFDIRRFPDPENAVAAFALCRSVEDDADVLKPAGATDVFDKDDARALAFAAVRNVARKIRVRWKWYDPSGALARDTGEVEVNPEAKSLELVTAYDALDIAPGVTAAGGWTVLLFIDGRLAARRTFSVSGGEGRSPTGPGT